MKALAFIFLFLFLGIFFLFFLSTQENYKNIPETSNTFSLTGLIIGEDETIEQFDKDIDLIIKEPNSIMKSSSNEYMDFQVDGGLRLSFDLLNQSEYVSGIEKKVREERRKKRKRRGKVKMLLMKHQTFLYQMELKVPNPRFQRKLRIIKQMMWPLKLKICLLSMIKRK